MEIYNMARTMKSSAIKTIVVRLTADNVQEFDINTEIFTDPFLEAGTRAVETMKLKHSLIRAVTEIWDKKAPAKAEIYNSYWLLVNAACYNKAELLREKFKAQTDCDLKKEPLHGRRSTGPKS